MVRRYQPLPFDWQAYFALRGAPALPAPETALITELLSGPLSILYAMERLLFVEGGYQKTVNEVESLTIHVLFASRKEV